MNIENIEEKIQKELKKREKSVVNKNAIQALFSSFSDPVGSLGKIFLGRGDALNMEKSQIAQEIILKLLARIDTSITEMNSSLTNSGMANIISGTIEVSGENTDSVTGVHLRGNKRQTELKPGTHIKVSGNNANSITGLKIED